MTAILLSYFPRRIVFLLVALQSLMIILVTQQKVVQVLTLAVVTTVFIIGSWRWLQNARVAAQLKAKAKDGLKMTSPEYFVVTDIGWASTYLLRMRTGVAMIAFMTVVTRLGSILYFMTIPVVTDVVHGIDPRDVVDWIPMMMKSDGPIIAAGAIVIMLITIRRIVTNDQLGYAISTVLLMISCFLVLLSMVGIMNVRTGTFSFSFAEAILPIIFLPWLMLPLLAMPFVGVNLYDSTRSLMYRLTHCHSIAKSTLSQIALHGRLAFLSDGLLETNNFYRAYYSWKQKKVIVFVMLSILVLFLPVIGVLLLILIAVPTFTVALAIVLIVFDEKIIGILFFLSTWWMSGYIWAFVRRLRLRSAKDILKIDPRPPILMLRSFTDDKFGIKGSVFLRVRAKILEVATRWCSRLGPVVAFGRPGEWLAEAGPPRIYVQSETWHGVLIEHIENAKMLVVFVGETRGLEWEMQEIIRRGHLKNTLFVFPPRAASALMVRWERLKAIMLTLQFQSFARFTRTLPEFMQAMSTNRNRRISLNAIDPTNALLAWYDEDTLHCVASRHRNKLAYEIAFKIFVEHRANSGAVQPNHHVSSLP